MTINIVPHDSLPPPAGEPFRLSVLIDPHLLPALDPTMETFQETDTVTSVMRKGRKAWADIARGVSQQLFHSDVTPLHDMRFYWPKRVPGTRFSAESLVEAYESFGMVFDRGVVETSNPPVVCLTATMGENGNVVFKFSEANEEERSRVNEMVQSTIKG